MKYNFSKVQVLDIDNKPLTENGKPYECYREMAKIIHRLSFKDLELVELAKEIYKGTEVEIDKAEIEIIKEVVLSSECPLFAFVKKAIKDYIESVK